MKNLSLLFIITLFTIATKAQDINVTTNNITVNDLYLVLHVTDGCGNVVGSSNPINVNWSNSGVVFDYSSISSSVGWALDPGACGTMYNWSFTDAEMFNCVGTLSTGSTACSWGNYNWGYSYAPSCPNSNWSCFEYSSASCTGTNAGIVIDFNVNASGDCATSSSGHLQIDQH